MLDGQTFNPWKMFHGVFIPESILKSFDLPAGAKLLYGQLCRHAGEDGVCFPRQETLAAAMRCTARTIRNNLARLVGAGLIARVAGNRGGRFQHEYVFLWISLLKTGQKVFGEGKEFPLMTGKSFRSDPYTEESPRKRITGNSNSRKRVGSVENPAQIAFDYPSDSNPAHQQLPETLEGQASESESLMIDESLPQIPDLDKTHPAELADTPRGSHKSYAYGAGRGDDEGKWGPDLSQNVTARFWQSLSDRADRSFRRG